MKDSLRQVLGRTRLRTILVVPFVLQIVTAVGLVGYLSFRNGQQAVTELVYKLQSEISARVNQHLDSYTSLPEQVHQANLVAIEQGLLDLNDLQKSERYFWQQAKVFKELSFIGYYLKNNSGVGAGLLTPADANPAVLYHPPGGLTEYNYATDDRGDRTDVLTKIEYNAIAQDWYVATKKADKPTWRVFTYPELEGYVAATLSFPIRDRDRKFLGILGVDLKLSTVSEFLRGLHVSPNGKIFILERDGMLIASSSSGKPYKVANGQTQRIRVDEVNDPSIQATDRQMRAKFRDLETIQSPQQFSFQLGTNPWDERQFVQIAPWRDPYGLDWLIVVTVPESDFMAQINANTYATILLCLGALALATAIGLWTARWITSPIANLNRAAKAIATGNFNQNVRLNRQDELGELSESFNTMANQLQTSFSALQSLNMVLSEKETQLEFYNETLEQQVQERTQELQETMTELKAAQEEAIQAEKMSALGHLVAGIAHEINTPLGAIKASIGNINSALAQSLQGLPPLIQILSAERLADFFTLLDLAKQTPEILSSREERQLRRSLKQVLQEENISNADSLASILSKMGIQAPIDSILQLLKDENSLSILDTAYHLSSAQNNSRNIQLAVDRAARIVYALKTYIRQDVSGIPIDTSVTESIDLVLTLYQNQIKRGVDVTRTYHDVPPIVCYPEELAQVWSNLISNAIQAMDYKGELAIAVSLQDEQIVVKCQDTGSGIPEAIQAKIFQPFFTTKPAGEGSGLGLSIVRKIIDKHHGNIAVISKPGSTTFKVSLPLNFQLLSSLDVK
jgi:signal transduction histidine kinase